LRPHKREKTPLALGKNFGARLFKKRAQQNSYSPLWNTSNKEWCQKTPLFSRGGGGPSFFVGGEFRGFHSITHLLLWSKPYPLRGRRPPHTSRVRASSPQSKQPPFPPPHTWIISPSRSVSFSRRERTSPLPQ